MKKKKKKERKIAYGGGARGAEPTGKGWMPKPRETEPENLSPPGKAESQAYGGGARETEPAGKGWKPKPMEAEPEKLSPPGKAGSQAYGGGAREAEPARKGWSCVYLFDFFYYILSKIKNRIQRIRLTKLITDDYVSTRTRSKARLETNAAVMRKAHEEGGDWTSLERLASAILTMGITGNAGMAKSRNAEAPAGEDEIETINGPENEPATYEAALRSPQAREWEEAMRQEWQALLENHTFDAVQGNHMFDKGSRETCPF